MVQPEQLKNWMEQKAEVERYQLEMQSMHYQKEKRIGSEYISRFEESADVPALELVDSVHVLTWHRDKPVVVREGDEWAPWRIPIVERAETPEAFEKQTKGRAKSAEKQVERWLKRLARERWGIVVKDWYQFGRQHLTATTQAEKAEPGSERFHLFLCATTSKLAPVPEDAKWSRRYITGRDLNKLVRTEHLEFERVLLEAHSSYLVRQAQTTAARP